jgi:acetyl-CoA C-acetyltransferase
VGKFQGSLSDFTAPQLGAIAVREAVKRANLDPNQVDECIMGNVVSAGLGQNPARQAAIFGGLSPEVGAMTINKVCGSGLKAVALAAQAIQTENSSIVVAGGMESMTNAPYLLPQARKGYRLGNAQVIDSMVNDGLWDVYNDYHMGITGENVAEKHSITREEQDQFAIRSQQRAGAAWASCKMSEEVAPVEVGKGKRAKVIDKDDHMRPETTMEDLAGLPTAFDKDGFVTAGNASGIVDGAAMMILSTAEKAREKGWKPLGRILSWSVVGVDPSRMGIGPAPAIRAALGKLGMELKDVDLFEINEAFAGQILAVIKDLDLDVDKLNVNGGAIALGHPLGASGTRLLITLLKELKRRGGGRGVASACIGGGQGIAMVVEAAA